MFSPHYTHARMVTCEGMDMFNSLIVVICRHLLISKHYTLHLKYILLFFVNHTSVKLGDKDDSV